MPIAQRACRSHSAFAAFLLLAGAAGSMPAQTVEQALEPLAERRAVIRLRAENAMVTGRLQSLAVGSATLETTQGSRSVSLAGVDSVWVRHRSTGTGALIGGIAGGVAGGVFVGLLAAAVCESDCENIGLRGGLYGFAIGGAGGALVGAAIGAAIPKWRLRWP
jgi:hypothetical protein